MIDNDIKKEINQIIKQEINLYNLLPKKTGMYLTSGVVISSYVIFFLLLMIIYFLVSMQKHHLALNLVEVTRQYSITQEKMTQLRAQYPISDPAHLQDSIKALQNRSVIVANELNILTRNSVFSSYLDGIANAAVVGAWLKQFTFNRTNNNLILQGFVIQHALLEQFLTGLNRQPIFKNLIFSIQDLTETTTPASFTIVTKQVELP